MCKNNHVDASTKTYPHPSNFCGGNFQDWLEVNLLPECNGKCSWCVEKRGWHPDHKATWREIGQAAINTGKQNIILLGGEPTLYKDLEPLIRMLNEANRSVWITTNGSLLKRTVDFLDQIAGVNISIHHYDLNKNRNIVGVNLKEIELKESIQKIRNIGGRIRLNCNLIKNAIDSEKEIAKYINFAKNLGATNVRFAELKFDGEKFVDLCDIYENKHGLTQDPFIDGCNHDTVIDDVPVNFRQMCGLQTPFRKQPINPVQFSKQVLYYDGIVYDGWQVRTLRHVLSDLAANRINVEEAAAMLSL